MAHAISVRPQSNQIEYQDSVLGQLAYMNDSNLAVWEVIMIAQDHNMDEERVASYFQRPRIWVHAAFCYYEEFPEEIDALVNANRSMTFEKLKQLLPNLETFTASSTSVEPN